MRGRVQADGSTPPERRHDYWGVVLDAPSAPALADFYAALLGWRLVSSNQAWATLAPPDGVAYLAFQTAERFQPPVWPSEPGRQQMMAHLDLEVSDLEAAVADAVRLGATVAAHQPQPHVRVLLDPAGHPFCLYADH